MRRVFVLLSLLAVTQAQSEETSFQATSVGTGFAIAGELNGTVDVVDDKVIVTISDGHIVRQSCPYKGERRVEEVRAFLASWSKARRSFASYAYSAPIKIEKTIVLGEIIPLEPANLEIPIVGLDKKQLENSWLAFSITDETKDKEGKPQGGSCYVHTVTSLAGSPTGFPAKREKMASGELKILETSLAPALAGLTPKPSLSFLPSERTMQADFRARAFKVSNHAYVDSGFISPRYEFGPDEQGFVLTAQIQDAGSPNSLSDQATPDGMNWSTDIGMSPVPGTQKQVSWSLSYGANLDPAVLEKLRHGLQNFTTNGE